jgi:hypothetical protein
MVVLAMIAALVGVLWLSYPGETENVDGQTVPVIRADKQAFRIEPDDRGGMDVPYRDSTIFQTLRDDETAGEQRVENLLDDETGSDNGSRFAGLNTKGENEAQNLFADEPVEEKEETTVVKADNFSPKNKVAVDVEVSDETRALVQSVLKQDKEGEVLAKIEPAAGSAVSSGNFFVQLTSLKTREAANEAWPKMQKKHSELSNSSYRVQEADLGAKGKFYRVQAGPYERDDADKICDAIKLRSPGGCLVVGR